MGFFNEIKKKIKGSKGRGNYAQTVRSHVIGDDKNKGMDSGRFGSSGKSLGTQGRTNTPSPNSPNRGNFSQNGSASNSKTGVGQNPNQNPGQSSRPSKGPKAEDMPMESPYSKKSMGPEPSLNPLPLEKQRRENEPSQNTHSGGFQESSHGQMPSKREALSSKEPMSVSESKDDMILDEIRFLKSEMSSLKSQLDAVNERLKNIQRDSQRRY